MRRGWKLSGVLVGLAVLAMACREPTPTPTPTINEARAIEIAREAGLEPGVEPWKTRLWHLENVNLEKKSYWWVKTTLSQSSEVESGRRVWINADTGDVIKFDNWKEVLLGGGSRGRGHTTYKEYPGIQISGGHIWL